MAKGFQLGDLTIHRVVEEERPLFDPLEFFPNLTAETLAENRGWLEPAALDPATGKLKLCIQSYIVRTPHHTILVDSCVGNHKQRPNRPFWNQKTDDTWERNLAATGYSVADIDYVMCTHLHVDHVGWNTRLENGRWVPTFPARNTSSPRRSWPTGRPSTPGRRTRSSRIACCPSSPPARRSSPAATARSATTCG
ncbi:MBL fold metallo-hydrolase [Paeniroseomonas aquatica]|uniref:MBL fold metallo-hydrolase n=1 Tax=Paeniroseomonas aquatica TaxID=373043 RepID=UPI003623094F